MAANRQLTWPWPDQIWQKRRIMTKAGRSGPPFVRCSGNLDPNGGGMTDYRLSLDAPTAALVQAATAADRFGTDDLSVAQQRRIYHPFCQRIYGPPKTHGGNEAVAGATCRISAVSHPRQFAEIGAASC